MAENNQVIQLSPDELAELVSASVVTAMANVAPSTPTNAMVVRDDRLNSLLSGGGVVSVRSRYLQDINGLLFI